MKFLDKITLMCFGASYAVSLALEVWYLFRARPVYRVVAAGFGFAGLAAHTVFLFKHKPPLASELGTVLFVAWILAIFYLYGSLHHRQVAWGIFALPLVIGLIVLAWLEPDSKIDPEERFWGYLHAGLLVLASVGVCVAFLASLMYLLQARQLKRKVPLGHGLKLLSLERLEQMNRRAIALAFPLLTAGILVGLFLKVNRSSDLSWLDPRVIATELLWLVFALLLLLRYGYRIRGRNLALLTIVAFCLLLFTMTWHHPGTGGGP
jgi:ABC-type transport system involved in cytochrome c biogenesis permease subunit